jgi:hypothetical protein
MTACGEERFADVWQKWAGADAGIERIFRWQLPAETTLFCGICKAGAGGVSAIMRSAIGSELSASGGFTACAVLMSQYTRGEPRKSTYARYVERSLRQLCWPRTADRRDH